MPTDGRSRSDLDFIEKHGGFIHPPQLDDYRDVFSRYAKLEREGGILQVRLHTDDGPVKYDMGTHNAWGRLWRAIGEDSENEVVILTATGESWVADVAGDAFATPCTQWGPDAFYNFLYRDGTKLMENFINDINVPTISAINGPGFHTEFALLCDVTLATPDTVLFDPHFAMGNAAGDGQLLVFQELIGLKRSAYALYTNQQIDAHKALELGLINEVLDRTALLPRAVELAEHIMAQPRGARQMTSQILKRPWKRRMQDDGPSGIAHQFLGMHLDGA
jgi:enoyl-CoA hydratase/carnithine racemase